MRHAFDFSNLVNRHSIHEIHPHPAELRIRQVLPDLRDLLGAAADFFHPVMRLLHADIRSGNRCCFLGKLVQSKGMISVDMILFLGSMIVCIRQGLPFQKFFLTGKILTGQTDDTVIGIHVNNGVGIFLVQRIAALSVKHNMSSVSMLGGW
ncbi:unknown [Eggerthella sp. CAG:1427]|nr:unknown [Eggerthella sp. CAG:1427]